VVAAQPGAVGADNQDMRGIKLAGRQQLRLPLQVAQRWGGPRKGAGRKPRGRPSVPHDTRAKVDPRYPLQVTIRAVPGLPSLRSARVFGALRRAIGRASVDRFRVIHFSIQQDHGHFIVEGDEARRARGGIHGLAIRLALAVNRALGRRQGKVVGDRYHVRPLTTPQQMRTSMVYVLLNFRKHLNAPAGIDPRSSGPHFSGWRRRARLDSADVASGAGGAVGGAAGAATAAPTTWMATTGWRRAGGLLNPEERPAASLRSRLTCRPPPGPNLIPRMLRRPAAGGRSRGTF
jgi:putative transposase